jgi:hypothetical protein
MYNYNLDISYNDIQEYRKCILDVFMKKIYTDDIADTIISECSTLKINKNLNKLFSLASCSINNNDIELGIILMFSYDFFADFHLLLRTFKRKNILDDKIYGCILDKLNKSKY